MRALPIICKRTRRYYTSRPYVKRMGRELESVLAAAEVLHQYTTIIAASNGNKVHSALGNLKDARFALSLFQHHDAITGTASDNVVHDYAEQMHAGLASAWTVLTNSAEVALSQGKGPLSLQPLAQRQGPMGLPAQNVIQLTSAQMVELVSFNSGPRESTTLLRVIVDTDTVCMKDDSGRFVSVQLNPVISTQPGLRFVEDQFEVVLPVTIKAFGLAVTRLVHEPSCAAPEKSSVFDSEQQIPAGFTTGNAAPAGQVMRASKV